MSKRSWLRNCISPRKISPVRKTPARPRLYIEALEDRLTPASFTGFVNLDNGLQFRLVKPTEQWDVVGGVYRTSAEVMIGLQGGTKFQPVLAVENGVSLNTNAGLQSFTITKPPGKDNFLDYFPNSFNKLSRLWEFKTDYIFQGGDLTNLVNVNLAPGQMGTPVTIAGSGVVPINIDNGLKINGNLGGSTLIPNTILITRSQDALKIPELNLSGQLSLNMGGKLVQKLISHLNINIGSDATYFVKADAAGLVRLVSQTGSGVWVTITPKPGEGTFTLGPVQAQMTFVKINWDQTNKSLFIAGRLEMTLKDDSGDATPFQLDLGDQTNPGLTVKFVNGGEEITRFQASFISGTRSSFSLAGITATLDGLFFLYDGAKNTFGIGGKAQLTFGEGGNTLGLTLGNPAQDQAGLVIADGKVKSFSGRVVGKVQFGKLPVALKTNVVAIYQAANGSKPSQVNLSGDWNIDIAGFTAGIKIPAPGLIIRNGQFSLPNGFGINLNGSFDIKGFQFKFDSLQLVHSKVANGQGGLDELWTITGGATLSTFFNVSVDLTGGGLVIRNGVWDLEGIKVHIANLTAGGFGLQDFLLQYDKSLDGKDYEVKVSATLALGLINVSAMFDIKDGHLSSIAADFKATGEDPGLPIGDTGLFITELGFEVDNLDHLSQWVFQGTVAVAFGDGIAYEGKTVRLFTAEGHFTADSNEFNLDNADFAVMDGYLAQGSGTILLNWGKNVYHVGLDVTGFDGLITLHAEFNLNQFNQITALADIGLAVPSFVPFIGGDKLADLEGLLYIDLVDPQNDMVAAWIDINTYIFGHWRIGGEFRFYPEPGQSRFQILWGSDVEKLEKEATSHEDGYHTSFTPTISATDPMPNQSLFTYEWENTNEFGDVTITVPGANQPVVIPKDSLTPVKFTANGKPYVVQAVKELKGERRFAFIIGPDTSVNANSILNPLPFGQYTVNVVTAEMTNGKLIHAEAFAPPEIKALTVTQPNASNLVTVKASYITANPASTSVDFYYTTDPTGGSGTLIKSVPLTDKVRNSGTVSTTWKIDDLPWKQKLYVFARASDVSKDLSGKTTNRTGSQLVSATSVTPYADLTVQLKVSSAIPVNSQPETLAGWPVLWQQLGSDGKTVINTVRDVTDAFGQAGISAGKGTNWTVTIAPKSWDGFSPKPGKGQTADASGQLMVRQLSGGSNNLPRQVNVNYQALISVHGQVSLDLTGNHTRELGGAGLVSKLVYADLNNNSQLDFGEPRTLSNVKGYYDLRFVLPTATTSYTIRLKPDASSVATFVRTDPNSTTNYAFQAGATYSVTVNPSGTHLFDNRDFLLQQPIIISGFAYNSGPLGAPFNIGSIPIPNATIHLVGPGGNQNLTTTTTADGSYQFSVLSPGLYEVYTDQQDPSVVNTPGWHALLFDNATLPPLTLTTSNGQPLFQVGYTNRDNVTPVTVSADFYGDGGWDMATLAWSPSDAGLYLVVFQGGQSPEAITASSYFLTNNFDINTGELPGIYWSHASRAVIVYFNDHALSFNPFANTLSPISLPALPLDVTQIAGFTSDARTGTDAWLLRSSDGSTWSLLTQTSSGTSPYSNFSFTTSDGIRPFPLAGLDYARMAMGDFDGDGLSDVAFAGVNTAGRNVITYLLSRERDSANRFTQAHTLLLGPAQSGSEIVSVMAIPLENGTPGTSTLSMLGVHVANSHTGTAELALFSPQPATGSAVAVGSPTASFLPASTFPLPGFVMGDPKQALSTDIVADMNGDRYQDLVVIPANPINNGVQVVVFLNDGEGQFTASRPFTAGQVNALVTAGLISVGSGTLPGANIPSVLALADDTIGNRLDTSLILAANTTRLINSHQFEIDSPGSYGGYHFGFVNATGQPTGGIVGTVYVDANQNGRQDPGEQNLVGRRVLVNTRNAAGNLSQQVLTTDATGKYTVTTPGVVVIEAKGLFPANEQPAHAPDVAPISLSPYTRASSAKYILALFKDELGRTASAVEVNNWATALNGIGGLANVASQIATSIEARTNLTVYWYETYLGRSPNQDEIAAYVLALAGQSEEAVLKTIVGSDEFYNRTQSMGFGGTPDPNYVRGLYQSLLGRSASSNEVDFQVNELHLKGKEYLSLTFLQSAEYRGNFIRSFFLKLLGRPGSMQEVNSWISSNFDKRAIRIDFESGVEYFDVNATTSKVGGTGIAVGGSRLVQTLDYGDTFTLGIGSRSGFKPNQPLSGDEFYVEYHSPLAPSRNWSPLWQISDDLQAIEVPGLPYPGTSKAGSDGGFLQAAGHYLGMEYGLRDQYVVQFDAVQTAEPVAISTGMQRDTIYGTGSLTVLFHHDGTASSPGIELTNIQGHADLVWDSVDGNYNSATAPLPIRTGTKLDSWNNYAVSFDQLKNTLSIFVNQNLVKTLDLKVFADGVYTHFSNAAITVGTGGDRQWLDNVQVGAPYVGYQTELGPVSAGYDFSQKAASTPTGAIQGVVVVAPNENGDPFAPGLPPLSGIRVYLDRNGDSKYTPGEPFAITDVHGDYRINSLQPGTYLVKQEAPHGYEIFASTHASTIVLGGQTAYGVNFSDVNLGQGVDFNTDSIQDYVRLVPISSRQTEVRLDMMDGTFVGRTQVVRAFDSRVWKLAGVGDFNQDGHPDLLFEKASTRELWYWQMHSGQYVRSQYLTTIPRGWHVAIVGDLDGRGTTDLVLRQDLTRQLTAWLMNQNKRIGTASLGTLASRQELEGLVDVNGDCQLDLVLHDQRTGAVNVRFLDGTRVVKSKTVGTIDPRAHLIGSQPWKPHGSTGLHLDWQHEKTGLITRWHYDYAQGLLQSVSDFLLGNRDRAGTYLTHVRHHR